MKFFAIAPTCLQSGFRVSEPVLIRVPEEFSTTAIVARWWVDRNCSGHELAVVVPRRAELRVPQFDILIAAKPAVPVRQVPSVTTEMVMSIKPPNRGLRLIAGEFVHTVSI